MSLVQKIEENIAPLLSQNGIELVDVTYQRGPVGWVLCFYLDKQGGITLADCEAWSGQIEKWVDELNLIEHAYSLEVSSPGINRPLKKKTDFEKFLGQVVAIKLYESLNGQKRFKGILDECKEDSVSIKVLDTDQQVSFPFVKIAKAHLEPEIKF